MRKVSDVVVGIAKSAISQTDWSQTTDEELHAQALEFIKEVQINEARKISKLLTLTSYETRSGRVQIKKGRVMDLNDRKHARKFGAFYLEKHVLETALRIMVGCIIVLVITGCSHFELKTPMVEVHWDNQAPRGTNSTDNAQDSK